MTTPALITTEKKNELPVLIVDKVGLIGEALAENIKQESLVILVSGKNIEDPNIIHVPYLRKIPTIPDNSYSHIFLVDESGVISKNILMPFIKKAKHDDSELILILRREMAESNLSTEYLSSYEKSKLVLTGDVFAKDYIFDKTTHINRFIKDVKENKKIDVPGNGIIDTSPIFLDDVIWGILQVGFIEKDEEKLFLLYPQENHTLLSVARAFQKKDPNVKIDFVPEITSIAPVHVQGGKFITEQNYDLESRIRQIDFEKDIFEEAHREEAKEQSFNIILPKKLNVLLTAFILTTALVILLPIIFTLSFALLGGLFLQGAKAQVEATRLDSAKNFLEASYYAFSLSQSSYSLIDKEAQFFGLQNKTAGLQSKIEQGRETSKAAVNIFTSIKELQLMLSGESNASEKEFIGLIDEIKSSLVYYQKQKQLGNIPASLDKNLGGIINLSSATIESWPELFGFKGGKKYLVLLQNNMELRPGGGFIGSFALVSIDKGKVVNFKIYDVYDADGQLKGHIEPPFAIRRYLASPNWYLRDSNYDVDFSKSAQAAAVFLVSELKQPVDGIIAVDLSFVRNLLDEIGDVRVLDYDQTVNSNNLFQVTQAKVETSFFPGSTQKKDFLTSLYRSIEKKLSEDKTLSYLNILQSITTSILEKHILFAFNKGNTEALFSVNGWGGTLFDDRKETGSVINDFLGISEANLGANKSNYYIARSLSLNTKLSDNGQITNSLKISFKNNADKNIGAKGLYKNYLRLILPKGATLSKVVIDGVEQNIIDAITDPNVYEAKNFVPKPGLEVERQDIEGNSLYGFFISVEPQALKNINITYVLSKKLSLTGNSFIYSLKLYKQPGIDTIPVSLSLNVPDNFLINEVPKEATIKSNEVKLPITLTKDEVYNVSLSKK